MFEHFDLLSPDKRNIYNLILHLALQSLSTMLGLLTLTLSLIISPLVVVQAKFPTDPCWLEDMACTIGPENLLSSLSEVPEVATCRQLCQDNKGCNFFSHFGRESFPLQELCLLFSSCDSLHPCEDCRTEEFSCHPDPCGVPLEGRIADNIVEVIPGVTTELDCKLNCSANPGCTIYTHYDRDDANFPSICFLLSQVLEPLQSCQHCSTGYPDCRNITGGICYFTAGVDTTARTFDKFTETCDTTVNILALGNCELTVVAVGGGGYGAGLNYGGGGGSGYVSSTNMTLITSQLVVRVRVGGTGELSSLETSEGQTIITAQSGGNRDGSEGGAGYCGGGGYDSYSHGGEGGQDGGDGDDVPGCSYCDCGAGSGLNISYLPISSFNLTPGRGGRSTLYYAGGGGGVLVEGSGPQETERDGQGYGGGGAGHSGHPGPGLVLLEMKPKN